MADLPIRKAVGAIIRCNAPSNHVLLVRKVMREDTTNKNEAISEWDLPKGGIKEGESEEQALWRELEEELGSKEFHMVQRLPESIDFKFGPGDSNRYSGQKTALFLLDYRGPIKEMKPISKEIVEILAVHTDELHDYIKFQETLNAIKKIKKKGYI